MVNKGNIIMTSDEVNNLTIMDVRHVTKKNARHEITLVPTVDTKSEAINMDYKKALLDGLKTDDVQDSRNVNQPKRGVRLSKDN